MISASPRPVKPSPTRRLFFASSACCGSGHTVTSSTLSSMRTATFVTFENASKSKRAFGVNGIDDERRQIDAAEAAAAVGGSGCSPQGFVASIFLAVGKIVIGVHAIDENHARLGVVVGRIHDLLPQIARLDRAVDPAAVRGLAFGRAHYFLARRHRMHQIPVAARFHRAHERVGHRHADVEVAQVALVLGVDEFLDVGMVAAQDAHLRAAPRTGGFHRFATAVEHAHVGHRSAGTALRAAHQRATRPDRREVVADAAAAAHGFRGFQQRHRRCRACRRPFPKPNRPPAARSS